ncbi:hypothetical protein BUALT_Bualt19G0024100 [Buddleja alternifolia]|uniref:Uncharacterized protein n=1 Tax=Buddleja alternifolia TaxID=168488 RepID=A0AAV6W1S8_9LAMI|nr:hypothetical protein BUALT_Bualt19G0024100 [Buddleja alternifolia]
MKRRRLGFILQTSGGGSPWKGGPAVAIPADRRPLHQWRYFFPLYNWLPTSSDSAFASSSPLEIICCFRFGTASRLFSLNSSICFDRRYLISVAVVFVGNEFFYETNETPPSVFKGSSSKEGPQNESIVQLCWESCNCIPIALGVALLFFDCIVSYAVVFQLHDSFLTRATGVYSVPVHGR